MAVFKQKMYRNDFRTKEEEAAANKRIAIVVGIVIATAIVVALVVTQVAIPAFERAQVDAARVTNGALENAHAGDHVFIGSYEQDGKSSNGAEPIEWRVLAIEDDKALLISEYGLDAHVFNSCISDGNDWDTSSLKVWLTGDFKDAAFDAEECSLFNGDPFCLSVDEAKTYLSSSEDLVCIATEYAKSQGVWTAYYGECIWWLRSPGSGRALSELAESDMGRLLSLSGENVGSSTVACVNGGGLVFSVGDAVDDSEIAVRPALWVNL